MDAMTRRLEINLMTLGTGFALFGLWTLIRSGLTLFVFNDEINQIVTDDMRVPVYAVVFAAIVLLFLFHAYIGISARSDGKGKKKTPLYLVLAGIGCLLYVGTIASDIFLMITSQESGLVTEIATIIIDITTTICLIELMISGIRLRRIRKAGPDEEKGGAAA